MSANAYATLSEPRQRFVDAMIGQANGIATTAWMIAMNCENRNSARAAASRAMKDTAIQLAIEERKAELREAEQGARPIEVTRERWIQEVARVAFDRDVKPGVRAPFLRMIADAEGYIEKQQITVNQVTISVDARSIAMVGGNGG